MDFHEFDIFGRYSIQLQEFTRNFEIPYHDTEKSAKWGKQDFHKNRQYGYPGKTIFHPKNDSWTGSVMASIEAPMKSFKSRPWWILGKSNLRRYSLQEYWWTPKTKKSSFLPSDPIHSCGSLSRWVQWNLVGNMKSFLTSCPPPLADAALDRNRTRERKFFFEKTPKVTLRFLRVLRVAEGYRKSAPIEMGAHEYPTFGTGPIKKSQKVREIGLPQRKVGQFSTLRTSYLLN